MPFAHFTLGTRDVTATANFFEQTFGWQPIDRPNNIEMPAAWLSIAPGQEMHLLEIPDFEPSPFEQEFGRHIAVSFPYDEFPALQDRLKSAGAELIDPLRESDNPRFFFKDPNGYMFEVVAE